MGLKGSFLPKPMVGVNGSSMHTSISISENGKIWLGRRREEKFANLIRLLRLPLAGATLLGAPRRIPNTLPFPPRSSLKA